MKRRLRKPLRVVRRILALAFVAGAVVPFGFAAFIFGLRRIAQASAK